MAGWQGFNTNPLNFSNFQSFMKSHIMGLCDRDFRIFDPNYSEISGNQLNPFTLSLNI